jgi:hypothetical protein
MEPAELGKAALSTGFRFAPGSAAELIIDFRRDAFRCPVNNQGFTPSNLECPFKPKGEVHIRTHMSGDA